MIKSELKKKDKEYKPKLSWLTSNWSVIHNMFWL